MTNTCAHSPAPNNTYLVIDNTYAEWYKDVKGVQASKEQVLPVCHALQGHLESQKMWIKLIDNIIVNQLGFHTTTHYRCIYRRVQDGETQLLIRQMDDFLCYCTNFTLIICLYYINIPRYYLIFQGTFFIFF